MNSTTTTSTVHARLSRSIALYCAMALPTMLLAGCGGGGGGGGESAPRNVNLYIAGIDVDGMSTPLAFSDSAHVIRVGDGVYDAPPGVRHPSTVYGVIRISLEGIPRDATVTQADLVLNLVNASGIPFSVLGNLQFSTLVDTTPLTNAAIRDAYGIYFEGDTFEISNIAASQTEVHVNLTTAVRSAISGDGDLLIRFQFESPTNSDLQHDYLEFASSEHQFVPGPQLVVAIEQ